MDKHADLSSENLVELSGPRSRRRLLGLLGTACRVPACEGGADVFEIREDRGQVVLRKVRPSRAGKKADKDASFVRVRTRARQGQLTFAEVLGAAGGTAGSPSRVRSGYTHLASKPCHPPVDLVLDVSWSVAEAKQFLRSYGLERVGGGVPLTHQEVESWMAAEVSRRVRRAARGHTLRDLRESDALPVQWWQEQLTGWLAPFSIAVEVHAARWVDATQARAEAETRRADDLARLAEQRRLGSRARQRRTHATCDYEARRARIDAAGLSPAEKGRRRQRLEIQHRKQLYEAELAIEAAGAALARLALEHERAMADLRGDPAAVGLAEARCEQAEQEHHQATRRLAEAGLALDQLAAGEDSQKLLSQLAGGDPAQVHQAAERLTSPQFGLSARQLAPLGFALPTQAMVQFLRDKAVADGRPVVLTKRDLVPREIGPAEVHSLPLGSSLQFELAARRSGYVSMLNIGTSGAVYVHIPNAHVGRQKAKVEADRTYLVPGKELLPPDALRQHDLNYIEVGPPGWEHIAIFISDKPLIDRSITSRSTGPVPLVELSTGELDSLRERLAEMPDHAWTCGLLSFLVGE